MSQVLPYLDTFIKMTKKKFTNLKAMSKFSYHISFNPIPTNEIISLLITTGVLDNSDTPYMIELVNDAFRESTIVLSARNKKGNLIGICRAITDYSRICFIGALAVHPDYQCRGVGRTLIEQLYQKTNQKHCVTLLANIEPQAKEFYKSIGMIQTGCYYSLQKHV